jgi:hypothetical protein
MKKSPIFAILTLLAPFIVEWFFSFTYIAGTKEENLIWFANRVYWSYSFTYWEFKAEK